MPCQRRRSAAQRGFTLIEIMLGASIIAIVAAALIGGFLGEAYLNLNARNLMAAMNDATRVMEQIRVQNTGCTIPSAAPPFLPGSATTRYGSWNDWLNVQAPAKTIDDPSPNTNELVVVACQDQDGGTAVSDYCGSAALAPNNPPQIGTGEWRDDGTLGVNGTGQHGQRAGVNTTFDPIRVTVSVGWIQRSRTIGGAGSGAEFTFTSFGCGKGCTTTKLGAGPDANGNGVIDSQAMLTTLATCR